jgi:hypothetical protein
VQGPLRQARTASSLSPAMSSSGRQPHEEFERVTATTLGEHRLELLDVLLPPLRPIVGHVVRHLVHHELVDPREPLSACSSNSRAAPFLRRRQSVCPATRSVRASSSRSSQFSPTVSASWAACAARSRSPRAPRSKARQRPACTNAQSRWSRVPASSSMSTSRAARSSWPSAISASISSARNIALIGSERPSPPRPPSATRAPRPRLAHPRARPRAPREPTSPIRPASANPSTARGRGPALPSSVRSPGRPGGRGREHKGQAPEGRASGPLGGPEGFFRMGGRFAHVSSPALCPCQVAQYEGEIALAAPPEHARAFTVEDPDRPLYLTHVDEQVACDLAGTQLHGDLPVQVLEVEGALQLPLVEPRPSKKSSLTTTPAPPPGARPLRAARRAPTPGMCGARRQRNGPWPENTTRAGAGSPNRFADRHQRARAPP